MKPKVVSFFKSHKVNWIIFGGIIVLAGILFWLAPAERTLGSGIKMVYLHVAFIWTGMAGLVLAGVLGGGLLIFAGKKLQTWTQTTGWVALGFFVAGLGMSAVAAKVNWGAVFWQEPRTAAMLKVVAVAIIVQVTAGWPISERAKGFLHILLTTFLFWSVFNTSLVLHPQNPIQTSPSPAIQGSFLGLFALFSVAAVWLVVYLRHLTTNQFE